MQVDFLCHPILNELSPNSKFLCSCLLCQIKHLMNLGRARSRKAFFCLLVSHSETESCLEDLAQFHSIEQQLLAIGNFEDDRDNVIDKQFYQIIPPYVPYGEDGPRITLQSSISLINRYSPYRSCRTSLILRLWVNLT